MSDGSTVRSDGPEKYFENSNYYFIYLLFCVKLSYVCFRNLNILKYNIVKFSVDGMRYSSEVFGQNIRQCLT